MARELSRGQIWSFRFAAPDKKRPVLVPITSMIRGAPSEVPVGEREGLKHPSAVNLDHVQTVEKSRLVGFIGHAGEATMRQVCRALAIAVGCDA